MKRIVIALGGNALSSSGKVSYEELLASIQKTAELLGILVKKKYEIVLVFGSGPQVGALIIQNELAKKSVAPMPLDVLDAEIQGEVGYLLEQALQNVLRKSKIKKPVVNVLTQVRVAKSDPAFKNPTKPIGPFLTMQRAEELRKEGNKVKEDSGRGYRKVVPSPQPVDIEEIEIIKALVKKAVVIAAGGGGIPVIKEKGRIKGIEAVIDKDRAAALLATAIKANEFIILTSVPCVYQNYGKKKQTALQKITSKQAKEYMKEGNFPEGSMGPKIEAAIRFLEKGGKKVIITSPKEIAKALKGREGTTIIRG